MKPKGRFGGDLETDQAVIRWAERRDECRCRRPVEGPVQLRVRYCRVCRQPIATRRKR